MDLKEKYRPKSYSSPFLIKTEAVRKVIAMHPDYPHLLLSGPPGCGKSTLACFIIPAELYGSVENDNTLIVNASDERSIEVIRTKIKNWATSTPFDSGRRLIVLDEGEYMTDEAQNALRSMLEVYSDNCLFILTCNNELKIIPPLKDDENGRCMHIRFTPPSEAEFKDYIINILYDCEVPPSPELIGNFIKASGCKTRKFLNILQAGLKDKKFDFNNYNDLPADIFNLICEGRIKNAVTFAQLVPPTLLTGRLGEIIFNIESIDGVKLGKEKVVLHNIIAEHDARLAAGTELSVQVRNLIYNLADAVRKIKSEKL